MGDTPGGRRHLRAILPAPMVTAAPSQSAPRSLPRLVGSLAVSAAALPLLYAFLARFPLAWPALATGLLAYALLLAWRPWIWLFAVPAALPVLDLAPWSGWIAIDEFDALLLVTVAVGYARTALQPPAARVPLGRGVLLAFFGLLCVAGFAKWGRFPWPADGNALHAYTDPANALRAVKGFLWALLLLPLMQRCAGPEAARLRTTFLAGVATGLALVCLAALWERAVFAGVLDFGSGYRTTALFSAMHVGGSTLDGYLAMTVPVAAYWLFAATRPWQRVLGALVVLFGTYTVFTTFSRAGYAVFLLCAGLLVLGWLRGRLRAPTPGDAVAGQSRGAPRGLRLALLALLGAGLLLLAQRGFQAGGYRLLAVCAVTTFALVWTAGEAWARTVGAWRIGLPAGLLLGAGSLAAFLAVPRSAYAAFALAVAATAATIWRARRGPASASAGGLAWGAVLWLIVSSVLAATYGRGGEAGAAAALWLGLAALAACVNVASARALWHAGRETGAVLAVFLLMAVIVIPIVGNYYAKSRGGASSRDLDSRLRHYGQVWALTRADPLAVLTGMGPGRFPYEYQWNNRRGAGLPTQVFDRDEGNRFVRLIGPRDAIGVGEPTRFGQRLAPLAPGQYRLILRVRASGAQAELEATLCEKLVIDHERCSQRFQRLKPSESWQTVELNLSRLHLPRHVWGLPVPVQFGLVNVGIGSRIDIDDVHLYDPAGRDLLLNNGFEADSDHWFFSASTWFWPWHVENIVLNLYFDLGLLGAATFLVLVAATLVGSLRAPAAARPAATVLAVGLLGILALGLLHSPLDVPRIALLFYLLLLALTLVSGAPPRAPGRRRRRSRPA